MRKTSWYRAALVGAVAIVLLNTWFAARALNTLIAAQFWYSHTLQVISQTETLLAEVRTAESSARGFVMTGLPALEEQYSKSTQQIHQSADSLQRLTIDNSSQQVRIAALNDGISAKLSTLEALLAVRRVQPQGAIDPALLAPVVEGTPDRMDRVQSTVRDIETEEQRLLAERTAETMSARRQVWGSFTLAFVLDFLLLVSAFELLVRAARDRERIAASAEENAALNRQLTEANEELETRVEQRTRELAQSNEELEAFSYSVSHDLRAPLRTIDGFSLALHEDYGGRLDEQGKDYINRVRNGVQRMGTLIDSLLQLSRVTRYEAQREQVDLSQLATTVFGELHALDPQRKVQWIAEPGMVAEVDPRLMRVAFENLIGNALKFTARTEEATIEFGSSPQNGETVYFLRDNGAGFDMQYVDRLFTAFQRLHGEREFKGSGIGLATVSRIIRRHHGSIRAEGEPGKGATFFFTLAA
ncbi:MAG TPA: CHASE3 domain-containing protein [Acidobacteriaceae bacterium]|nr:CHASE3 domain-containing protein [Acidobacteriaceae bacterium]